MKKAAKIVFVRSPSPAFLLRIPVFSVSVCYFRMQISRIKSTHELLIEFKYQYRAQAIHICKRRPFDICVGRTVCAHRLPGSSVPFPFSLPVSLARAGFLYRFERNFHR